MRKRESNDYREDGKIRVQLFIDIDVYESFCCQLIDEFGTVDYNMSRLTETFWNNYTRNQGRDTHTILEKRQLLRKLANPLKRLIDNFSKNKEISQLKLDDLFSETTSAVDKRTFENYRKILRKAGVLNKPKNPGSWAGGIIYPIDINKAKTAIEELSDPGKEFLKKKITQKHGKTQ